MRKPKFIQLGFVRGAILPATVLALVGGLTISRSMARQDEEHARFHGAGKTINGFLASYCEALKAVRARDSVTPLLALYSPEYEAPGRGNFSWADERWDGDVVVQHRRVVGHKDFSRDDLAAELLADAADLASLERAKCKIDLIEDLEPERRARLTARLVLDGFDAAGRLVQDRYLYRFELVNPAASDAVVEWRIRFDELLEGVRVAGAGNSLMEVEASALGIDFRHRRDPRLDMKQQGAKLRFGVMQHASGGLAAADYNGDGQPDLLFLDGRHLRLYRNQGLINGLPRFTDVTAATGLDGVDMGTGGGGTGVGGIGQAHAGLFADFDNDGDRDLFISRYLATNLYFRNESSGDAGGGDVGGGDVGGEEVTFVDISAEMGLDASLPATSVTALDYDRDGDLDLYLGVYGNAFERVPRLPFFARNGGANRLYRNDGQRGFSDVTEETGVGDTGWSLAVTSGDYDGDGWIDLAVANDFGRKNLYHNEGRDAAGIVTFTEVAEAAGVLDFGAGMGLAFADYNEDGRPDLYTSNIHSNQRWFGEDITVHTYLRNLLKSRWAVLDFFEYVDLHRLVGGGWIDLLQRIGKGNTMLRNEGGGRFSEAEDIHAEIAGWGWGVAFFDYDNDTDLDIYAANGWISNTPETDL